jgi:hypothetical protein
MLPNNHGVSLRPFPHPFRAALALCSDVDGCTPEVFRAVHRYLNDPARGLGLPVADSFFPRGREPGQLAFYLPDGLTPGPHAGLILAALKTGLIDALHSWGDFNGAPPDPRALRALAEDLTRRLTAAGLKVPVWINHGDAHNYQNLSARLQDGYQGDDPASPWYTVDLARRLGVRFAWCSELVPWPLSPHRPRRLTLFTRVGINSLKNFIKIFIGQKNQRRRAVSLLELAEPLALRDGSRLLVFNRFNRHPEGLWARPGRHTLRYALAPEVLADLIRQEGFLIVYTHLGLPREGELFLEPDREAVENLAGHYRRGEVWVAPTSRLLTFWLVRRHLLWQVEAEGERLVIHLKAVADPQNGCRLPQPEELAGLAFYSPRPEATVVRLYGRDLPAAPFPPDHTGCGGVGLPLPPPPELPPEVA